MIEYDSFCLKTKNGYTVVWLTGDNNVTEGGRYNRRVRSWSCFMNLLDEPFWKIQAAIVDLVSKNPNGEVWKKHSGKWILGKDVAGWIAKKLEHAMTVEDLIRWNYGQFRGMECAVNVWRGNNWGRNEHTAYVRSSSEFDAWIEDAKQFYEQEIAAGNSAFFIVRVPVEKVRQAKVFKKDVVFKTRHGYLTQISHRECGWSKDRQDAVSFPYAEALAMLEDPDIAHWLKDAQMVSADAVSRSGTPVVIYFEDGRYQGQYVSRCCPSRVMITPSMSFARKYPSERAALQAMERIQPKVNSFGRLAIKYFSEKK